MKISDDEYEMVRKELEDAREKADNHWVKTYKTKIGKIFRRYMEWKLHKLDREVSKLETRESGMALARHLRIEGQEQEAMSIEGML